MRLLGLALAVTGTALMLMPQPADAFTGRKGTRINPVNEAVFEVIPRSAGRGAEFWCGAADYARRALKADWRARLYIARTRGPSVTTNRRSAVHFTLAPEAAGIQPGRPSVSLNALVVGDNMSIQQAYQYCDQNPVRF